MRLLVTRTYLFRRFLSVLCCQWVWREEDLVLERARGCLQVGDPGSGVAEFKVNSGYFRTHGKRGKRCVCVCVCLSVCVRMRVRVCVQTRSRPKVPENSTAKAKMLSFFIPGTDPKVSSTFQSKSGGDCVLFEKKEEDQKNCLRTRLPLVATVGGRNLERSKAAGCVRIRLGRYLCTVAVQQRYVERYGRPDNVVSGKSEEAWLNP